MVTKSRPKGKHTNIVNSIAKRLFNSNTLYDKIIVEEEFDTEEYGHGECDVHALYDSGTKKYLLCFEVKSSYSPKNNVKARYQLEKDECFYKKMYGADKVFKFTVFGSKKNSFAYSINKV